jgi:hypothetical protein
MLVLLMFTVADVGVDWRHKLETQRGAVLATELKNNANKLAKWTAAALVSGVEIIKLGYVSRVHQRDTRHHVILGTQVGPLLPAPVYMVVLVGMGFCENVKHGIFFCSAVQHGSSFVLLVSMSFWSATVLTLLQSKSFRC